MPNNLNYVENYVELCIIIHNKLALFHITTLFHILIFSPIVISDRMGVVADLS